MILSELDKKFVENFGPDDWPMDINQITEVEEYDDSYSITQDNGWSLSVGKEECRNIVIPKPGHSIITFGGIGHQIQGIVIAGHVVRYNTRADAERKRKEWLDNYAKEKEQRYLDNIERWREEVNELHPALKLRIQRFINEQGEREFWTEDGGYELYVLKAATALLKRVKGAVPSVAIAWIEEWNKLGYEERLVEVPNFGDGHSGNTYYSAVGLAKAVLRGQDV